MNWRYSFGSHPQKCFHGNEFAHSGVDGKEEERQLAEETERPAGRRKTSKQQVAKPQRDSREEVVDHVECCGDMKRAAPEEVL